jgi:hypothetical protein
MSEMTDTPLIDIWDQYSYSLAESVEEGLMDDPAHGEIYVWPRDLALTDIEKEDIKRYTHERVVEIMQHHPGVKLDGTFLASYVFRSLMVGLMLEKQKDANLTKG